MAVSIPIVAEWKGAEAFARAKTEFAKLEGVGKKAGIALQKAILPATAAVAALGAVLFSATKDAIADAAAQDLLANNLKRTTNATDVQIAAVEDWISVQGRLLGVSDDELRPALSRLARATGSITKAQKLASQAMDISAATGKPLATVIQALERAYGGNMAALSKLAPEYRDLIKDGASFEEVMNRIAVTTGGAAADAAETTQGKFKRFKIAVDELKESLGATLLPVMEAIVSFLLDKVLPAFDKVVKLIEDEGFIGAIQTLSTKLWDWIAPQIKPMLIELGKFIAAAAKWLFYEGLPKLVDAFKKYGQKFVDWIEPQVAPMTEKLSKFIAAMVVWMLTVGLPQLQKMSWQIGIALLGFLVQLAPEVIKGLARAYLDIANGLKNKSAELGISLGKGIANGLISQLNKAIDAMNALLGQVKSKSKYLGVSGALVGKLLGDIQISQIPQLAEGGVVNSATLAVIGEAGPEAVIPLDRMGHMTGNVNITVQTGVGDPVAIGREVARVMDAYSRRSGRAA